jgi:hypothetical protein
MLSGSAFPGGGGVFDGRGLAHTRTSFSQNITTIRLDSEDPERKRIQDDLVVRQVCLFID